MRVIRRSIGLVLGALMFLLNFERADLACSQHADRSQPEHATQTAGAHHHDAASHAETHAQMQHGSKDESCTTPVQSDCCLAMTACSTALGWNETSSAASIAAPHDRVAIGVPQALMSRVAAPEPPPPRI